MTPLVLLAGMNCTADLWAGCGVDDALTPPLTESSIDAQVERLLDTLPDRFTLGGLSLGAIVAMHLAVRAPERVSGLCLVSTNARPPTPGQREGWRAWVDRIDAGTSAWELQSEIVDALVPLSAGQGRAVLVERTLAMGIDTGAQTLRSQLLMQGTRTGVGPALRALRLPALVCSGSADGICPPQFHEEIASDLDGARLMRLRAGHLLPMERSTAFGTVLRGWRSLLS